MIGDWVTEKQGDAQRSVKLPRVRGDIDAQIAQLETYMKESRAAYNKDTKSQLMLRALYAARENRIT